MSKAFEEGQRFAQSRKDKSRVFNHSKSPIMEFDKDYSVILLPTEPIIRPARNYERKEYVFFISYTDVVYSLILTEVQNANLCSMYGDVYELYKGKELTISRTKVGSEFIYKIKNASRLLDANNQSHTIKEQEHVNAEINYQETKPDSDTGTGSTSFESGGHEPKKIVTGESAKVTSPATPTVTTITDSQEPDAVEVTTHEVPYSAPIASIVMYAEPAEVFNDFRVRLVKEFTSNITNDTAVSLSSIFLKVCEPICLRKDRQTLIALLKMMNKDSQLYRWLVKQIRADVEKQAP